MFRAQCDNPVKGDWVCTVKEDLEGLEMHHDFEQIKTHTKESFKRLVKEKLNEKAFEYLKNLQQTHSKAKPLQYENKVNSRQKNDN